MLRRHSSKGLERRKSTSSAHSKHESMDPEVARHYAQTAAMLAYNRALERNSTDVGHRAGGPSRSTGSHNHQTTSQQAVTLTHDDHGVRRQQSVRFAGPNAVQRRQSVGTRAYGPALQTKSSTITLRPVAMTTNAPVPAAYRPPSRSSSIGKASLGKATAASFVTTNAFDEYYTREDDVASTPSSYRRVRRSKSMFSPLKAPSVFYTNGSPNRQESTYTRDHSTYLTSRTSQANLSRLIIRAPKSMSFLRSNQNRGKSDQNDAAVQMARDRFFHETTQQRLREQPSFLFRSKAQQQDKTFRKSVRENSEGYGLPIASANQDQLPKESALRDVARKASKTIRKRLRKVFGRSKDEHVSIPNQQVDARESHVRKYNGDSHEDFLNIPLPDEASLSSVAARNPALHAVNSSQKLRSYAGSVKSLKSDNYDEKSRVTSWTSTGVNTIASQTVRPPMEREQQRLSIINEFGTHVPSSSFQRQILPGKFSDHLVAPGPSNNSGNISHLPYQGQVDSARVYSALMKRLDENSPKSKLEASHKASMENFIISDYAPRSRNSAGGSPTSRTPATIRHVVPEDPVDERSQRSTSHDHQWVRADSINSAKAENMFGHTGSHVHQWTAADALREARMRNSDDVFSPKHGTPPKSWVRPTSTSSNKENCPPSPHFLGHTRSSFSVSALSRQASAKTSYHTVPESFGLTPQELAIRNEPLIQEKKRLRDSRSTFFGGTSVTIARATSPYRRAMAEAEYGSPGNDICPQGTVLFSTSAPLLKSEHAEAEISGSEQNSDKAYSESIYSRTTNGQPVSATSEISFALNNPKISESADPTFGSGDVVIVDRSVYRPANPKSGHHRRNDSMGSTEWKRWMSSEVAKLERPKEVPAHCSYVNYALPTMPRSFQPGHIRESAQINDDEVRVPLAKVPTAKQPLGTVQQLNPNIQNPPFLKPILKKRSAISLVENTEFVTPSLSIVPIPPPPPPIPDRSPLRVMPSRASLRSQPSVNTPRSANRPVSISGKNVLHKRNTSQGTLRSAKSVKSINPSIKSLETPAKLTKRNRAHHGGTSVHTWSPSSGLDGYDDERIGSITPLERDRIPRNSHLTTSREYMRLEKIQREETESQKQDEDMYGTDGSGLLDPIMGVSRGNSVHPGSGIGRDGSTGKRISITDEDSQVKGSKMMVDLFLSSRRRRIAGGSEDSGVANGPAFL